MKCVQHEVQYCRPCNNNSGPDVGDRVLVALTGTVRARRYGRYPSLEIELDSDLVVAGTVCAECDPGADCDDDRHPVRDQVLTFDDPANVGVVARTAGGAG